MKIKTTIIAAILCLCFFRSFAQTIPNAGFETWINYGSYSDPDGWSSFNSFSAGTGVFTAEQGSPGAAGASFLKLSVKYLPAFGGPQAGAAFSSPSLPWPGAPAGFPVSTRPANLTGKYQYQNSGMDTMAITIMFSKWNPLSMTSEVIGAGNQLILAGSITSWTSFSIPVTYFGGVTPDSASISIWTGSPPNAVLNDYLYIDELAFSGIVSGMDDQTGSPIKMTVSPNPFATNAVVTFSNDLQDAKATLVNILGKEVRAFVFSGRELILEKDELTAGVYFIRVEDGKNVSTRKIVIQ